MNSTYTKFVATLCCPIPRINFGTGDKHVEDEIIQMEDYLKEAKGDFVVFPEGYLQDKTVSKAEELAKKYNKWLIVGSQDTTEEKSLYTLVISPTDGLIYSHTKTSLTDGDRNSKAKQGKTIEAVDTPYGKIGTVLCYEMHFPEVARIECLDGAYVLFNTIGTGMWHEQQLDEWTTIAKARAIENRCFVLGCTHYCDPIPLIFAYDPHGRKLVLKTNYEGMVDVEIDPTLIDERNYFNDRNPEAYTKICSNGIYKLN